MKASLFSLEPGDAWVQEPTPDPDPDLSVYRLFSEKHRTLATISEWPWEPPDLEAAAKTYLEIRRSSEEKLMGEAGRTMSASNSMEQLPLGYQIEYWGNVSGERQFRYWGMATPRKIVNIYLETYSHTTEELDAIFRDLLAGLKL